MSDRITEDLFKTNAIRVAPADTPFWYTSGKLGPFFINTHFLVKDEGTAADILKLIEEACADNRELAPSRIFNAFRRLYEESETYRNCIDEIVEAAKKYDFDFISGGERRDFFFSMMPAYILKKPHLTIFKDLTSVFTDSEFNPMETDLKGKKSLHIADLITEASSYERAWIPAIKALGAAITDTIAVVDRHQNGRAVLEGLGVNMETLTVVDEKLFGKAKENGTINEDQYQLVLQFLSDPDKYMKDFIASHPTFIDEQISLGGKNEQRARLAIEKGFV
ncbi:MAG: orotate phosphoribosyltransferase [Clostridiales bacterium]|nr:orotate phosphoribosyltransferase [Clostridiales bacterium]